MRRVIGIAGGTFALLLLLVNAAPVAASPIVLHGTGEGLVEGQLDPFWTVELPGGTAFGSAISATDPNLAWIAPTPPNTWISVVGQDPVPAGVYKYSTTFEIGPGFDPGTAQVSGHWWADEPNEPNGIYLNGVEVSTFNGAFWFDSNFASAFFSINSGFVSGTNVLTFYVENTGGPGGMLVQDLRGSVAAVPEPTTFLLLGSGLALAVLRRGSRSRA